MARLKYACAEREFWARESAQAKKKKISKREICRIKSSPNEILRGLQGRGLFVNCTRHIHKRRSITRGEAICWATLEATAFWMTVQPVKSVLFWKLPFSKLPL